MYDLYFLKSRCKSQRKNIETIDLIKYKQRLKNVLSTNADAYMDVSITVRGVDLAVSNHCNKIFLIGIHL